MVEITVCKRLVPYKLLLFFNLDSLDFASDLDRYLFAIVEWALVDYWQ